MIYIITVCGSDMYDSPEAFLATTDKEKAHKKLYQLKDNVEKAKQVSAQLGKYSNSLKNTKKSRPTLIFNKLTELLNASKMTRDEYHSAYDNYFEIIEKDDDWQ